MHLRGQILLAPMKSLKQCWEGTPSVSKEVKAVTTCHPSSPISHSQQSGEEEQGD